MDQETIKQAIDLVRHRLTDLQRPDWEKEALAGSPDEESRRHMGLFPRDFGMDPWDWPQGVGLYGMQTYLRHTGDANAADYLRAWFRKHLDQPLPRRNINTTCPLLTLVDYADEEPAYAELCQNWADWLMKEQPRTLEGGFQHTTTKDAAAGTLNMNEGQMWIDTLFMTVLFLAKWGVHTNNEAYCQEAVHQFLLMVKYLYERRTGLFYHAWSFPEKGNFGQVFWCRGNSWYTAAAMDFLSIMRGRLGNAVEQIILDTWLAQVDALATLQAENGLWHTVLDDSTSYTETSGSAAITYGILRGLHTGVLRGEHWETVAEKALQGLVESISPDGTVQGVSAGTPVGRDASHYKGIRLAPMAYGQSLTLMALAEAICES